MTARDDLLARLDGAKFGLTDKAAAEIRALVAELSELKMQLGMANHAEDSTRADLDAIKTAIFGNAGYEPTLTIGSFCEMARTTEAARVGALSRAEYAESELRLTHLAQMGPAADRYDAPEWIWASPDIDDGWRWPVLSKFPIQGPPIEKQVCFVRADLSSHLAQMGQAAERYDALVTAIRPVADMADISGVEFARKHPALDAKLDKVEAENWGAVLADVVSDALAAWEKHNG